MKPTKTGGQHEPVSLILSKKYTTVCMKSRKTGDYDEPVSLIKSNVKKTTR